MSDQIKIYQQIIAKCWGDAKFKASLIADPSGVVAAEGFIVPVGKTIKIVECLEDEVLLEIPINTNELSLEELDGVAGGWRAAAKHMQQVSTDLRID